jgi:carbonic anhydrase
VDSNYAPETATERVTVMICEHVLCQIENVLTHPFAMKRVLARNTSIHGWVIDDESARVFGYDPEEFAFMPI